MTTEIQKILKSAVSEGFLTPNVAKNGLNHSVGFLSFKEKITLNQNDLAIDLGTGGGLPGLILSNLTICKWLLIERSEKRSSFLKKAVRRLDLVDRVQILNKPAEEVARDFYRGTAKLVTSRSFGPPSLTAECAAPFLKKGGLMVVSEPPFEIDSYLGKNRWPAEGLEVFSLKNFDYWNTGEGAYKSFLSYGECPDLYPRRFKTMLKKPIF